MTAEELHRNIYNRGLYRRWAEIVEDRWTKNIRRMRVRKTGELAESFKRQVIGPSGIPDKIRFEFLKYGKFVDMGVGKGVKVGEAKEFKTVHARALGLKNPRRAKKWYSKTMYGEVKKLSELLASEYGREAADFIKSNLKFPMIIEL